MIKQAVSNIKHIKKYADPEFKSEHDDIIKDLITSLQNNLCRIPSISCATIETTKSLIDFVNFENLKGDPKAELQKAVDNFLNENNEKEMKKMYIAIDEAFANLEITEEQDEIITDQ